MDVKYLICLFSTTCTVSEVLSLTCYQCDSITTPNCKDPFSSIGVTTTSCIGVCTKGKVDEQYSLIGGLITRDCVASSTIYHDDVCQQVSVNGYITEVCTCNSNLCNAAGMASATWSTIVISAILSSYSNAYWM